MRRKTRPPSPWFSDSSPRNHANGCSNARFYQRLYHAPSFHRLRRSKATFCVFCVLLMARAVVNSAIVDFDPLHPPDTAKRELRPRCALCPGRECVQFRLDEHVHVFIFFRERVSLCVALPLSRLRNTSLNLFLFKFSAVLSPVENSAASTQASLHVRGHTHSASSLRNALHPSPINPLANSVDNILSPPRGFPVHAIIEPDQHQRRSSHATTSSHPTTTTLSALAAASWDDGLIAFDDTRVSRFDEDTYTSNCTSPITGPLVGSTPMVKSEPDDTHCQFILENYAEDGGVSPNLDISPLDEALGFGPMGGGRVRTAPDTLKPRTNSLPLRAVNACPEMYAMMGIIRLDPFASVNGVPQNRNVPSLWNGEPRPLDEDPIMLEWQVDLLEPLVPQTPESDYEPLPDVGMGGRDEYHDVKLGLTGPLRRERMRSPRLRSSDRYGSAGSYSSSISPRGSASPLLRMLNGSKPERNMCRSPLGYSPRGPMHGLVGRRDSDDISGDLHYSSGVSGHSLMDGSSFRGNTEPAFGRLVGHDHHGTGASGYASELSGNVRDTSCEFISIHPV